MATTEYEVIDHETGEVHTNGTAVARVNHNIARRELVGGLLRPVASPDEVLEAQNEVRAMVAKALQKDRDFGVIPGTQKPTLLKPGAERINAAYGLGAEYNIAEKEIDHDRPISYVKRTWEWHPTIRGKKEWSEAPGQSEGLYRYVVECRLIHRASGVVIGQGIGSCSTMESKYIDRPRDLENTVLKMASKRAYIAATLNTHGLSDQFTQDIEDNPEAFGLGKVAPARDSQSAGDPWDKRMPFGKTKGTKLGDLAVKDLESAKAWCEKTDAKKFAPLIEDIEATLRHKFDQTVAEAEAPTYDDPAPPMPDDGDDLPY